MRVHLHNPKRDVEVGGPLRVTELVKSLGLNRESVLVIRGDSLVTGDATLADDDEVEIRPVISGGSRDDQGQSISGGSRDDQEQSISGGSRDDQEQSTSGGSR